MLLAKKVYRVRRLTHVLLWLGLLLCPCSGQVGLAQQQPDSLTPGVPQIGPGSPGQSNPLKSSGLFEIFSRRSVEVPPATYQPMTVGQKFGLGLTDTFHITAYGLVAISAAIHQAENDPKKWGQGWDAYGKRYAASFADRASATMMVESFVPAITGQDPRYFRLGQGGIAKRTGYALSRALVTRTDSNGRTLNISEIGGNAISAGISNAYYPGEDCTLGKNLQRWGIGIGEDALFNVFNEFWPDVRHHLFKK